MVIGALVIAVANCSSDPAGDAPEGDTSIATDTSVDADTSAPLDPTTSQQWRGDHYDPNDPVLAKAFVAGEHVRRYWGGCTTLLAVFEDGDTTELLLYDGYVSKDASGLVDFTVSEARISLVRRYADFIEGFMADGFEIRALLTTHSHADHVGDIPLLLYYVEQSPDFRPFATSCWPRTEPRAPRRANVRARRARGAGARAQPDLAAVRVRGGLRRWRPERRSGAPT